MSAYETLIGEAMINPGKADLMMARVTIKLEIQNSVDFCCPSCGIVLDQKRSTVMEIRNKEGRSLRSDLRCSPCGDNMIDRLVNSNNFWPAMEREQWSLAKLTWANGEEVINPPEPPTDPRQIDLL